MWKIKTCASSIVSFTISVLLIAGCGCLSIEPTYTKEKIVESITSLCKQEYNIEAKVWLAGETVWIYIPLQRLIAKEEDAPWDKEMVEKVNKVIVGASRVVLSMKPRPQFMVVAASDTQEYGIDYFIITWIPDIVKYQLEFISRDEFSRRHVMKIMENPLALNDLEGKHIKRDEIKMADFIAAQITQRIQAKFILEPQFKDYFEVNRAAVTFENEAFWVSVDIKQVKDLPQGALNTQKEILKIIAYVIKEYGFKDFLLIELENTATAEKSVVSRAALNDYLKKGS
jgi:hypothetical protein